MDDIKRAYRRLAQRYHPDKSGTDPDALIHFAAIKEAYETLTQPEKRADYMQQRWYARSQGESMTGTVATPANLLRSLLNADRQLTQVDTHRTNYHLLLQNLLPLLDAANLDLLKQNKDAAINNEMVLAGLRIANRLPYPHSITWLQSLKKISTTPELRRHIEQQQQRIQRRAWWEKRKPLIMLAAAAILCLLFMLLSHH